MEKDKDIRRIYMDIAEMLVSRQESFSKVTVITDLVEKTDDLLTAVTSKELVSVVIENTFPAIDEHHFKHENFPEYLKRYFNEILDDNISAYIPEREVLKIWDIPEKLKRILRKSDLLRKNVGEFTYLWEDLITHLGTRPLGKKPLTVKGTKSPVTATDPQRGRTKSIITNGLQMTALISEEDIFRILGDISPLVTVKYSREWSQNKNSSSNGWYSWEMVQSLIKRLEPRMKSKKLFDIYAKMYANLVYTNSTD